MGILKIVSKMFGNTVKRNKFVNNINKFPAMNII